MVIKISQRKVLYACFKRNLTKEIKVAQLAGYTSEHAAYHHGEASLVGCIIGCAQEFVGSNNINTLMPKGQFGTRIKGGKDSASERYIFTHLTLLTKYLYNPDDNAVLKYQDDDGFPVEPEYYVPTLPMIAINGAKGIGTGFSCDIPPHNTLDIIAYIQAKLSGKVLPDISVYFEGFTGTVEKVKKDRYLIKGKYEIIGTDLIRITELPVGTWTEDYKEFLESLIETKDSKKSKKSYLVKSYMDMSTDTDIDFKIKLVTNTINRLLPKKVEYGCNELEKRFRLYTTKTTTNMYLFDSEQRLKKYNTVASIIDDYIPVRMQTYHDRIAHLIKQLEREVLILSNKARFIQEQCDDIIDLRRKKREEVIALLGSRDYDIVDDDADYKYLRTMRIEQVEEENIKRLLDECKKKLVELKELRQETPTSMWRRELQLVHDKYIQYRLDRIERQKGSGKKVVKRKKKKKVKVKKKS